MSRLTDTEYEALARPELLSLVAALDALAADEFEAELASDILTLEHSDGTTYVLNSHRAARQLWMAAERQAWHFDWDGQRRRWIAARNGDELWATLERLLSAKLGHPVELIRSA